MTKGLSGLGFDILKINKDVLVPGIDISIMTKELSEPGFDRIKMNKDDFALGDNK
ncbi:MAG: hypothetical protein LBJ61_02660 [Deltaproteobacteria bacterium]|jgi:hypothetical protein|nr:hypothetical protein [Deltaproteobacteria bacterium]